ncbi:hypothetical protein DFH11DRAFT_832833 [Phellopilus nigrolimitatus]|nr:hypothetical protein DFH11DRAFT_832833 [Phellopilus nigrolimitatus]
MPLPPTSDSSPSVYARRASSAFTPFSFAFSTFPTSDARVLRADGRLVFVFVLWPRLRFFLSSLHILVVFCYLSYFLTLFFFSSPKRYACALGRSFCLSLLCAMSSVVIVRPSHTSSHSISFYFILPYLISCRVTYVQYSSQRAG